MVPETSTVYEIFRRMAVFRVDALFLNDSNGNLWTSSLWKRNNNLWHCTLTYCLMFLHFLLTFLFRALITLFWIRGEMNLTSLRLSKALMVPETSTVYEVFRWMAVCRVDALFLTDSNGNLLSSSLWNGLLNYDLVI
jgi:hypothetical protein